MKFYNNIMKKLFLSTTLLGAMMIVPHNDIKNNIKEDAVDMLQENGMISLNNIRKEVSSEIQMSETYVQSAVVDGAKYLRFVTAVKLTDTMEKIVYHRSITGMEDANKEVTNFYKTVSASGSSYYYDGTNLVTEAQDNGFYFACYTIQIESDDYLSSDVSAFLTINDTKSSTKVTSSFNADQSENKCVSKDTDGNKVIRATHQYGNHIDESYFKAPATCEHAKEYYKSCDFCGVKSETEIFTDGEALSHQTSKLVSLNAEGKFVSQDHCSLCDNDIGDGTTADVLENAEGVRIQPITLASADQGISISYHFAGSNLDWGSQLFMLSEEEPETQNAWWISAGCIGHQLNTTDREQLCDGADGQGQEGEFQLETGWNAILAEGNYTLSLNVDGSIIWYKDNEVKLYFAPDKVSNYFPTGEINTAREFVPALINQMKTYGIRVGTGVSNLKISYGDTKWGFATVDYVKTGTSDKVTNSTVVGPLKEGADVEITYPDVPGYALKNASETAYTGKMTAGRNVVKTVEYNKTSIVATVNCYTGSQDNPGVLVHTENKSIEGETYEFDAPSTQMYETKAGKISGTAGIDDFTINVYGYDLKEGIVDVDMDKGEHYPALPSVNENTGVFVSFDFKGPGGDWRQLFESEHFIAFAGCFRYLQSRDPYTFTDYYDGTHGVKNNLFNHNAWDVISAQDTVIRVTFEFTENGDLVLYRNGAQVLKFNADTTSGDYKISDMVRTFIEDVRTQGFWASNINTANDNENNTNCVLSNLQVGYATELHQDVEYKVMVGDTQVSSYRAPYLTYAPAVPYGYTLVSKEFSNGVVTLHCQKNVTLSDNLISEATTVDRYDVGGWTEGQYTIASNIEGDYYYEVEINNIDVNNHAGNTWRGLLINTMGTNNGVNADEVTCLGNNNHWSSNPSQLVLTSYQNNIDVYNQTMNMQLIMTRRGKFYYVEMICTYGDTTVVNTYTGYGYDTTIRSLNICSEFARFTVASVKSGTVA